MVPPAPLIMRLEVTPVALLSGIAFGTSTLVYVVMQETGVLVGVFVGTPVGVLVGVLLGVFVGVLVGVFVGVKVGPAGVGVFVGVLVGVRVAVLVGVGAGPPQPGNLNAPMRVRQLAVPVVCTYSVVIQKVQSSVGSMLIIA